MRISIITLALGLPPYIDEAIASVSRPSGIEIEHVVVHDGPDGDFTELTRRFPALTVLRGPGQGATAAANHALRRVSGDFVFFLNSDDRMAPRALSALSSSAQRSPEVDIWTGRTVLFAAAEGGREAVLRSVADPAVTALTLNNVLDDYPLLSARFIRRSVYERFSGLDAYFHTCSDREFMIRLALAGVPEAPLNELVSQLRLHDESATIRPRTTSVPRYLDQHVELARRWMADPALPPAHRAAFKDWHARELLRLAYYQVRAGRLREAAATQLAALGTDPLWPWRARSIQAARRMRRRNDPQSLSP